MTTRPTTQPTTDDAANDQRQTTDTTRDATCTDRPGGGSYPPAVYAIGRKRTPATRRRALLGAALESNDLPTNHHLRETAKAALDDPRTHKLGGWGEIGMQLKKASRAVRREVESGNGGRR